MPNPIEAQGGAITIDRDTKRGGSATKTEKIRKLYDTKLSDMNISSIKTQEGTISNNHKLVIKVQDRDNLKALLESLRLKTHWKNLNLKSS